MKVKSFILQFSRYFLVAMCFLAISSNTYSFYYDSQLSEDKKASESVNQNDDEEGDGEELRYCAYEAVVPAVHFNIIYHFVAVVRASVTEAPTLIVNDSPAFFTRPFYRTLFRMIISPNAP